MKNKFIKFIKDNVIIIVPSTVIILVLTGFVIFGLAKPNTTMVYSHIGITDEQKLFEETFMSEYNKREFDETAPFFIIDPFNISPLTGLIIFETEEELQFRIVVKGKTEEADIEYISAPVTEHFIPVYGLYPAYNNSIEIYTYVEGEDGEFVSSFSAQTLELPNEVTIPTTITTSYEYFGDDIMIVIPALKSLPVGFDYNGDVRWYLTKNFSWSPKILENGHILLGTDRVMSDPYYTTGLYEIDYLGKVYREYKIPGGYHHDSVEMADGNLLVLTSDFEGTVEDKIVEIDRLTGDVLHSWDLEEILPTFDGMAQMWTTYDWYHNNSIDFNETTNEILLSGRHQDAVISIDKDSGTLNYVIGDPDNWGEGFVNQYFLTPQGESFEWQYAQHSAKFLPNGDIFLFDNGNNKSKNTEDYIDSNSSYSRGVIYRVNHDDMTITQIYEYGKDLGSDFYSPYISNVDYYADNHYLIHSGGHGVVDGEVLNIPGPLYDGEGTVEFKSMTYEVQDNVVQYYLELADNFYQAKRVSLYNDQTTYQSNVGLVFGELAETIRFEGEYEQKLSLLDTVPPRYEVTLLKENDRLKFDIKIDRTDEVYLLLVSGDEKIVYSIPTSRTAFTAMCSATFQGDERFITYYINETNLTGDYDVYLVINGREYNTYGHVIFN